MSCFHRTNTLHGDHLTVDKPSEASCAALCCASLAPWEGIYPEAFASEALLQLAAELSALELAMFPESSDGAITSAISSELAHRVLAGIEKRARAAAEVLTRLHMAEREGGAK